MDLGAAAEAAAIRAITMEMAAMTVNQTGQRQLIRTPHNINDPEFAELVVTTFHALHGSALKRATGG